VTDKEFVLSKFPKAWATNGAYGNAAYSSIFAGTGDSTLLSGRNLTQAGAWSDAARRIRETEQEKKDVLR